MKFYLSLGLIALTVAAIAAIYLTGQSSGKSSIENKSLAEI